MSETDPRPPQPRRKHRDSHDWISTIGVPLTYLAALAAAIFTGIAACYTVKQWRTAVDVEHRQLRAYLTFSGGRIFQSNGKYLAEIYMTNTGPTPAYNVRRWWSFKVMEDPYKRLSGHLILDKIFPIDNMGILSSDIGGSQKITLPAPEDRNADDIFDRALIIKQTDIASMKNGTPLFVWGGIRYRDVFQRCQHVLFAAKTRNSDFKDGEWPLVSYHESSTEKEDCDFQLSWYGPPSSEP